METAQNDSIPQTIEKKTHRKHIPVRINIEKEFKFDQYTLADTFPYKDTVRVFQWDKIRESLRVIDSMQRKPAEWGVLRNRRNANGEAPLVEKWHRNSYTRVSDEYGVERWQGIPFYRPGNDSVPERYGRDGSWVRIVRSDTTATMTVVNVNFDGEWNIPKKYVKTISDTVQFRVVAVVDRTMQTIATFEKVDDTWFVRSMNPATTGIHKPPYAQETPLGIFVVQEKKPKMLYTHDGSSELAGFAPWASRFCNGAYIHGVPTNDVNAAIIEYSWTLGTTPRSHMCVRNASSHAKFWYDLSPIDRSLVVVIE
ncbi:L,D-transpeptidase [Alistipes sp. OttesenSCG-928-B03]|nr:L,D-transpeptidase [Alistipes sp. OttesenSCG-928-B03]